MNVIHSKPIPLMATMLSYHLHFGFRKHAILLNGELLVPCPTLKLEDHSLSSLLIKLLYLKNLKASLSFYIWH